LELHQGNVTLATNEHWKTRSDGTSQQAEVEGHHHSAGERSGVAIVTTLNPGSYTASIGEERWNRYWCRRSLRPNQAANSELANVSSRGFVETNDNVRSAFDCRRKQHGMEKHRADPRHRPITRRIWVPNVLPDPTLEPSPTATAAPSRQTIIGK